MPAFPTEEWLQDYVRLINASDAYKEAGATWEGDLSYVVEAEPDKNLPGDVWLWMNLWSGECKDARVVSEDEGARAQYVIRAPYSRWKDVLRKELDPVKAIMQGKLRLKGDLPEIIRHVKAANVLVEIASEVPTEFPDE